MKNEKLKSKVFRIIESPGDEKLSGSIFDLSIIILIIINLILVIIDTFKIPGSVRVAFAAVETVSVIVFTAEYMLRFWTADMLYPELGRGKARIRYIFTFLAIVDLVAVLPFYIPFVISLDLRVLQTLRIARLLRLFKVNRYTRMFTAMGEVLKKRIGQLLSSMLMIFLLMIITSVLMYNFEHDAQPEKFDNAFSSFWWAMATLTTVGYGDIYPITFLGKIFNGVFAFLGIGLIAIPTGIISAGFVDYFKKEGAEPEKERNDKCFCPYCGKNLDD